MMSTREQPPVSLRTQENSIILMSLECLISVPPFHRLVEDQVGTHNREPMAESKSDNSASRTRRHAILTPVMLQLRAGELVEQVRRGFEVHRKESNLEAIKWHLSAGRAQLKELTEMLDMMRA